MGPREWMPMGRVHLRMCCTKWTHGGAEMGPREWVPMEQGHLVMRSPTMLHSAIRDGQTHIMEWLDLLPGGPHLFFQLASLSTN